MLVWIRVLRYVVETHEFVAVCYSFDEIRIGWSEAFIE